MDRTPTRLPRVTEDVETLPVGTQSCEGDSEKGSVPRVLDWIELGIKPARV